MQFSSVNFAMNLDPAFSSASLSGRKRHTTLILSSASGTAGGTSVTEDDRDMVEAVIDILSFQRQREGQNEIKKIKNAKSEHRIQPKSLTLYSRSCK